MLGTLCVVDKKPLALGAAELDTLKRVARQVAGELVIRSQRASQTGLGELLRALNAGPDATPQLSALLDGILSAIPLGIMVMNASDRRIVFVNEALAQIAGLPRTDILRMTRNQWIEQNCTLFDDPSDFIAKLAVLPKGVFAATETFEVQRPQRRTVRWTAFPLQVGEQIFQVSLYDNWPAPEEVDLSD